MRLLIFGAGGFIGSQLAKEASTQGHEVVGLSRSGSVPGLNGTTIKWEFGDRLPESAFENINCAIHLAHDFSGDSGAALTIEATLESISLLRDAGVPRQIFFSSYSAGARAISLYGKSKLAIERRLVGADDVVIVRPGLVLGDGGIYGRIAKLARILPIIPLPDGGRGLVPVITIERLCRETLVLAQAPIVAHESNLFEADFRSLRQLVQEAAAKVGREPVILPVPAKWMIAFLQVADFIRVPLPVNTDNLKGFIANQKSFHRSTLSK